MRTSRKLPSSRVDQSAKSAALKVLGSNATTAVVTEPEPDGTASAVDGPTGAAPNRKTAMPIPARSRSALRRSE